MATQLRFEQYLTSQTYSMIELGVDDRVHVGNSLSQTERDLGYQCSESEVAMLYTAITELKTELANSTAESVMSNELKIELAKSKAETDKLKQDLKAANQTGVWIANLSVPPA